MRNTDKQGIGEDIEKIEKNEHKQRNSSGRKIRNQKTETTRCFFFLILF